MQKNIYVIDELYPKVTIRNQEGFEVLDILEYIEKVKHAALIGEDQDFWYVRRVFKVMKG